MKNIKIIEVNSELGAGTRGASLGVDALRVCCANQGKDLFKVIPTETIPTENDLLFEPNTTPNAKRGDGIVTMYNKICTRVKNSVVDQNFTIVLAGDHSNAGGTMAGVKMANQDKRMGVIWIDAHADIHTPYTTPSGNMHGMPIATALGIDNKQNQRNELSEVETQIWEQMKMTGGFSPKFNKEDLIYVAVRDTEEQEDAFIADNNIKNFTVDEVRAKGVDPIVEEAKERLSDCDIIYVTFDVDSMDSSISVGTGTPVENGLTVEEAKGLVEQFGIWDKTVCLEFTEINPCLDTNNVMARTAYKILENLVDARKNLTNDNEHNFRHTESYS